MDYDRTTMPASYDAGRGYTAAVLDFWMQTIAKAVPDAEGIHDILDLGCGTGRYSTSLATHFNAELVGVDPSEKMLAEAEKKKSGSIRFMRGSAEAVPLADQAVDMVFISMVFHHFKNHAQAAAVCPRVLRGGGVVCLRAAVTDRFYPCVPFFPEMRRLLNTHLQSVAFIEETFQSAGFERFHYSLVPSEVAANWPIYADKIALRVDSVMARLSDEEFADGLTALRKHAETAPMDEPVIEMIDFFVFRRA
jgi:ubiquinone/menaquinone biosynthesis C-methylase UbiE